MSSINKICTHSFNFSEAPCEWQDDRTFARLDYQFEVKPSPQTPDECLEACRKKREEATWLIGVKWVAYNKKCTCNRMSNVIPQTGTKICFFPGM